MEKKNCLPTIVKFTEKHLNENLREIYLFIKYFFKVNGYDLILSNKIVKNEINLIIETTDFNIVKKILKFKSNSNSKTKLFLLITEKNKKNTFNLDFDFSKKIIFSLFYIIRKILTKFLNRRLPRTIDKFIYFLFSSFSTEYKFYERFKNLKKISKKFDKVFAILGQISPSYKGFFKSKILDLYPHLIEEDCNFKLIKNNKFTITGEITDYRINYLTQINKILNKRTKKFEVRKNNFPLMNYNKCIIFY